MLAIIGEKDIQVPPKENILAIEEALIAGGNEHYTVIEETISPVAMNVIGEWITQETGK